MDKLSGQRVIYHVLEPKFKPYLYFTSKLKKVKNLKFFGPLVIYHYQSTHILPYFPKPFFQVVISQMYSYLLEQWLSG